MRQLSIPYAEEKKYVRFYVLVAIAILFHTHAFMFTILPLLFSKPWGGFVKIKMQKKGSKKYIAQPAP